MKDEMTKREFMALRTHGKSYDAIAGKPGVSKRTLPKSGNEHKEEAENLLKCQSVYVDKQ